MKKVRLLKFIVLIGFMLFIMGANTDICDPVPPPFDATGHYEGDWWSGEGEHCPAMVDIEMNADPAFPALWDPKATFTFDFDCLELPPEFPPLDPIVVDTVGLMDEAGNLTFIAFGCTIALCLNVDAAGVGIDEDGDGMMDTYTGDWALILLVAGIQPLGVAGEFEVHSVPVP